MNLYRGCQHGCIYCDSRSECYQIDDFTDIQVKVNAPELLRKELSRKRIRGTIGTGSMNDPYMPLEKKRELTRTCLGIIQEFNFPVHILTKSDLVLRDLDMLREISRIYAAVSFTITTSDDALGKKVEPGASLVSKRFIAMKSLAGEGIMTGVLLMPLLPFLQDNEQNVRQIVQRAADNGAAYIIPGFGMTLRDRQKVYYYNQLDQLFPGVKEKYLARDRDQYFFPARRQAQLESVFREECERVGLAARIPQYAGQSIQQLKLI